MWNISRTLLVIGVKALVLLNIIIFKTYEDLLLMKCNDINTIVVLHKFSIP